MSMSNNMTEDQALKRLIKKAAQDLVKSKFAIALTGAGMSTESGIPDFKGPSGLWTKNPQAETIEPLKASQSYQALLADPQKWWQERLTHPSQSSIHREKAVPNQGHYALAEMEDMMVLLFVITSNVDGLHEKAGTQCVIEFHGSFLKLRCISCGTRFRREEFDLEKLIQKNDLPPRCPTCQGIIKPDGVSFGEAIPADVQYKSTFFSNRCDVMLICRTTASVFPFAELPRIAKQRGARIIEVNTEPTRLTKEGISNYIIQGRTGEVLPQIVAEIKKLKQGEKVS
ncbi:NAD-dependent deacetylase [Chloroflexota bacterium]